MNPMKSEVKVLTMADLGADMDDLLEAAEGNVLKAAGGAEWIVMASKGLASVSAAVDKDLEEEVVDLEVAKYAKRQLQRVAQSLADLVKKAQASKLGQQGIVLGIQKCVAITEKKHSAEKSKLEGYLLVQIQEKAAAQKKAQETTQEPAEAEGSNGVTRRRPRSNPAAEDLQKRKEEARAAKKTKAEKVAKAKAPKKGPAKKKAAKKKAAKKVAPRRRSERGNRQGRDAANT